MYNCDFKTIYSEVAKEFVGHDILKYGYTNDGYGLFAKATSSISVGVNYLLPTGILTSTSTVGALKVYVEVALVGSESEPVYAFVRCFGKNGAGNFVVPEVVAE